MKTSYSFACPVSGLYSNRTTDRKEYLHKSQSLRLRITLHSSGQKVKIHSVPRELCSCVDHRPRSLIIRGPHRVVYNSYNIISVLRSILGVHHQYEVRSAYDSVYFEHYCCRAMFHILYNIYGVVLHIIDSLLCGRSEQIGGTARVLNGIWSNCDAIVARTAVCA